MVPTVFAMSSMMLIVFEDKFYKAASEELFRELSNDRLILASVIGGFAIFYIPITLLSMESNLIFPNKEAAIVAYACFIAASKGKFIRSQYAKCGVVRRSFDYPKALN